MRLSLLALSFLACLTATSIASGSDTNRWETLFHEMLTADWTVWSVTHHYQRAPADLSYLNTVLGNEAFEQAVVVAHTELVVTEQGDQEGGYDLGIIELHFPSSEVASTVLTSNRQRPANLTGTPLFVGYDIKQCGAALILLYSKAAATEPLQRFFQAVRHSSCQPNPENA
jgi:hypothetical protein